MKKFFKTFGLLILFNFLWSIIILSYIKSQPWGAGAGVLHSFLYLVGALVGDGIFLFISSILYLILFYLKKLNKIQIDNMLLFSFGYILMVIVATVLQAWLKSKLSIPFNLDMGSLTFLFYTPFIYCFISYNLFKPWILGKVE